MMFTVCGYVHLQDRKSLLICFIFIKCYFKCCLLCLVMFTYLNVQNVFRTYVHLPGCRSLLTWYTLGKISASFLSMLFIATLTMSAAEPCTVVFTACRSACHNLNNFHLVVLRNEELMWNGDN